MVRKTRNALRGSGVAGGARGIVRSAGVRHSASHLCRAGERARLLAPLCKVTHYVAMHRKNSCICTGSPYNGAHAALQHTIWNGQRRQILKPEVSTTSQQWRYHMSLTTEQILAAHKANMETLFGLTNKAFEGVEKLVELNLQVAKAALAETAENTKAVLSRQGRARTARPASQPAAAVGREGRCLQPPPVRHRLGHRHRIRQRGRSQGGRSPKELHRPWWRPLPRTHPLVRKPPLP